MSRNARWFVPVSLLASVLALTAGCLEAEPADGLDDGLDVELGEAVSAVTMSEGFETGSKTAYAAANVALASGTWNLDEVLLGNTAADVKTGAQSARARNSGKLTMLFDRTTGAGTVTIRHATYGTDANGTWGLFSSTNSGSTWSQVGTSRTTAPSTLATTTFTVNVAGTIRFEIRKLDGGANRINLDAISITDYGGGGGGGGGAAVSKHTTLGLPSPVSTTDPNAFLSAKAGYAMSYNGSRKVPNWVSWQLNASYLGSVDRQDNFRADNTFPAWVPQASLADYSGSGYDRGHLCPSADRTRDQTSNSETFYLTNMIPQAANNNRGAWADLETEARNLLAGGRELYVIAGGTFSAGSLTIGNGVRVPDKTFKVIVVMNSVGQGPSAVTTSTRVIAVLMPNANSQISESANWRNYRVSVDAIEAATGLDFLSDVAPSVQAVIEARVDNL